MSKQKKLSLSELLGKKQNTSVDDESLKEEITSLQLRMLRIQQGVWHRKSRAIIVFEGFDAAGKGGVIRRITQLLDPRSVQVHPIGPPTAEEQGKHWLYRFWNKLPARGTIAIFDRSWYGRVLVERVDKITPPQDWRRGFEEINQFERSLVADGVQIVKIFLAISKEEQLKRFESRLADPYKQWKITKEDMRARKNWKQYVEAVDEIFRRTSPKDIPWNLIAADRKNFARREALRIIVERLHLDEDWMLEQASKVGKGSLARAIKDLRKELKD
jgi:polyphosphate kinase 2 (PPK2 family)